MVKQDLLSCDAQFLEVIGWLASVAAGCYVNLVTVAWEDGRYPSPLWSSAYAALHRVVWAACLGWVVYACAIGRGGECFSECEIAVMNDRHFFTYFDHLSLQCRKVRNYLR